MSKPTSQDNDGGRARTRLARRQSTSERATTMRPVESVGRFTDRLYCPSCGQKVKACRCQDGERP